MGVAIIMFLAAAGAAVSMCTSASGFANVDQPSRWAKMEKMMLNGRVRHAHFMLC